MKLVASEATPADQGVSVALMLQGQDVLGLTPEQALHVMCKVLKVYCTATGQPIPADDFIKLSLSAMTHLQSCGRSNVVYGLVKCLGTMRSDGSDSLLPAKRMPLGLIEHCVDFFKTPSLHMVGDCVRD